MFLLLVLITVMSLLMLILIGRGVINNFFIWYFSIQYIILFDLVPSVLILLGVNEVSFRSHYIRIVNSDIMHKYIFLNISFLFLVFIGYIIGCYMRKIVIKRTNPSLKHKLTNDFDEYNFLILISSILALIGIFGMIYFSGVGNIGALFKQARFTYWETRNTLGFLLSEYLASSVLITSFLVTYKKSKKKAFPVLVILLSILDYLFLFRSRTIVIGIALSLILGYLLRNKSRQKETKLISRIILPIFAFGFVAIIWQRVRHSIHQVNSFSDFFNLVIMNAPEAFKYSFLHGDLSYFFIVTLLSMELIPNLHDYLYGSTYLRILLLPFPHSLLGSIKPEETQRLFAKIIDYQSYQSGATFPPTIIGDAYINFGFFGIFIGLFIGIIIAKMQKIINRDAMTFLSIAIASTGSVFLLLLVRGTFNGLYNLIFNILVCYGAMFVYKKLRFRA